LDRWRDVLRRLGLVPQPSLFQEARGAAPPEAVDPCEIAMLLLKNAMRLLDQTAAPPEVINSLTKAIRELEEYIAAGPE
jgi:hypothetical protein